MLWFVIPDTWGYSWVIKQLFPAQHSSTQRQLNKSVSAYCQDAFITPGRKDKLLLPLTQKHLVLGGRGCVWGVHNQDTKMIQNSGEIKDVDKLTTTSQETALGVALQCCTVFRHTPFEFHLLSLTPVCNHNVEQCFDTPLFHVNQERSCQRDQASVVSHTLGIQENKHGRRLQKTSPD